MLRTTWHSNTVLFLTGIFSFAWLIGANGPMKWLAIPGLVLCSYAVFRQVLSAGKPMDIWDRFTQPEELKYALMGAGLVIGIGIGIAYRVNLGMTALPQSFTWFAFAAAAIGATEELLFRGVLYYLLKNSSVFVTVLFASLAHAGYKTLLFASPFAHQPIDLVKLFSYTFIAGLILGSLRILSASTGPPLAAHVLWDIIVYGDSPEAPWWVW